MNELYPRGQHPETQLSFSLMIKLDQQADSIEKLTYENTLYRQRFNQLWKEQWFKENYPKFVEQHITKPN